MKFSRLFKEGILFWPCEIDISDGELIGDEGGYFPLFNKASDEADKRAESINDWHEVMSWAISCGLHKLACEKLKKNDKSPIIISEIDRIYVQSKFSESLFGEHSDWPKQIRRQYVNDLKS